MLSIGTENEGRGDSESGNGVHSQTRRVVRVAATAMVSVSLLSATIFLLLSANGTSSSSSFKAQPHLVVLDELPPLWERAPLPPVQSAVFKTQYAQEV